MRDRFSAAFILSCLIFFLPAAMALSAAKYPPGIRWREIEGNGITVIFPAQRSAEALEALATAAALNERQASFWGRRLPGRLRIVLSDSTDDANGFATFFPFNLVGADLAEPPPDSELAGSGPLLDLVLAHELTHLFTMHAGPFPFRAARRIFGSNPAFFPAAQLPPWAVEGLAVEEESRLTGDGRLDHAPYRLMLATASRSGQFPSWSGLAGMPTAWPGPNGKYLFGAGFMEFLGERYGLDSLRKYAERFSTRLFTFGSSRDFRKIFGKPLDRLWGEYADGIALARRPASQPVTPAGFYNRYPCAAGADSLVYYHRDYRQRGTVARLDLKSGECRTLFRMDAVNALSCSWREDKILLSACDFFHSFSDFSDLYEYDMKGGRLRRLSCGQRLSHPVKKEKSAEIFCVQRRNGRCRLAVFNPRNGRASAISIAFAGMAQPALSPDGKRIAVAAKPVGAAWGIAVFKESGALERFLAVAGSDLSQPGWQDDDKLLFIVSGKETSHLASYSLEMESGWRLEDPRLAGLRQFDLERENREIFFARYSGRGEEIARLPLAWVPLTPMEITAASGIPGAQSAAAPAPRSRPYRPGRDLLPRWWSPALRSAGNEVQAGIMTGGQDALGMHSYTLEGYYGLESRRPNLLFQYAYDGLFPTLSLSGSDTVEYYSGSDNSRRTRELKLASLWPLRLRKRSQLHAYADLHFEKRSFVEEWGEFGIAGSYNGLRLGCRFNSAREYYDSISPADGVQFALQGFIHPAGLGNVQANRGIQAEFRHYIPLSRPAVLAWRLAVARSWEAGNHYYEMGGLMAGSGLGSSQPFRLLRGFNAHDFLGNRGWQFNLECRLPLFKIEKAILPAVSLDRIWLAPFFDMGRIASEYSVRPIACSAGVEAVLRLAAGGAAATDLSFGIAHGFRPEKQWWVYLRTGRSF